MACTFVFRLQVAVIEGASWELVSADWLRCVEYSWDVEVRRYARPERRVRHDCAGWWRPVGESWPAARAPRRHPAPRLEHRPQLYSPHICTHTIFKLFIETLTAKLLLYYSTDSIYEYQTPSDFKQFLDCHCILIMSSHDSFLRKTFNFIFKLKQSFLETRNRTQNGTSLHRSM